MSNSMLYKVREKMAQLRDNTQNATVRVLPDSMKAPTEIKDERWALCSSCEHLYEPTHTCKLCGCFMKVKTSLARAKCPAGKWLPVPPISQE